MIEPNPAPQVLPAEPDPAQFNPAGEKAQQQVDWPSLPVGTAVRDPGVAALLERLGTLPALPVGDHGEVYAGLHAELMEALNDAGDPAS